MKTNPMRKSCVWSAVCASVVSAGRLLVVSAITSVLLSGCGAPMAPASGSIQLDGEVFPGGKVIFTPLDEGKLAIGYIQQDGTFQLVTDGDSEGAIIGRYRVTVAGNPESKEKKFRTTYVSPREQPLEIAAGNENSFQINVSTNQGWQAFLDDR